ncbi:MAG: PQQ-like beta-propeller repeat protein [Armatimonadetes bacterium]|nr:PQQ-like beta-propeller repeat protein [Armatimonadota bacterium]
MHLRTTDLGPMGTGSNMFRCGLVHSTGIVYLGTYGPPPGIIWRYDPANGELTRVAAPGEYQLDCMVEAPDGRIHIGTAYSGLVYRLDPATGSVESLGSPEIDSTSWIFTLYRTSRGDIYGAKGVGLFRLHWQDGRLEPIGLVPGDHATIHPSRSGPIVRQLEEAPDGTLWGDTNRWLFRFHPETARIEPVADMALVDPACYALFLPTGKRRSLDTYFCLYSRFSGAAVRERLYVHRHETGEIEPVTLRNVPGDLSGHPAWWREDGRDVLLMQTWEEERQRAHLTSVDPPTGRTVARWSRDSHEPGGNFLFGPCGELYFFTFTRLFRAEPAQHRFVEVARNPTPAECRCLAVSPAGRLGTDTYDLGYAFTLDPATGESRSHGKVWADDHRANHGPAAFAGRRGRYLLANHGEAMPALWATDTLTNRHRRVGPAAVQLVRFGDGTVWGTQGPNPSSIAFDPAACWVPGWQARPGTLFRWRPGAAEVEAMLAPAGPIAEAPGRAGRVLAAAGDELVLLDCGAGEMASRIAPPDTSPPAPLRMRRGVARSAGVRSAPASMPGAAEPGGVLQRVTLPGECIAMAGDSRRRVWLLLADGTLLGCRATSDGGVRVTVVAEGFGPAERGFFALRGGRVVGVALDGTVSVWRPGDAVVRLQAPPPLPAGPAVDAAGHGWCYAHRSVERYELVDDGAARRSGRPAAAP